MIANYIVISVTKMIGTKIMAIKNLSYKNNSIVIVFI